MKKPDLGTFLHFFAATGFSGAVTGGAAFLFGGSIALILWVVCILILGAFGWLREVEQHDPHLTPHQSLEAIAWTLGGILGGGAVLLGGTYA